MKNVIISCKQTVFRRVINAGVSRTHMQWYSGIEMGDHININQTCSKVTKTNN